MENHLISSLRSTVSTPTVPPVPIDPVVPLGVVETVLEDLPVADPDLPGADPDLPGADPGHKISCLIQDNALLSFLSKFLFVKMVLGILMKKALKL